MTFKKLTTVSICLFMVCLFTTAQNKYHYAYVKSTVNANELIAKTITTSPFTELYDDWNNTYCHAKTQYVPEHYKIDLRNFSMPVKHNLITSNFGYRPKFKRNHYGVDLKACCGDTIYAAFSGKVRVVKYDPKGYGNVIVIRHWNGLETVYGHLSKQIVKINDIVEACQPIGLAGNTGRSTGPHLHFETRFCGIAINPNDIFAFQYRDVKGDFFTWKR